MILVPKKREFKLWLDLVPIDGDVVFFKNSADAKAFRNLGVPILTAKEAALQGVDFMGLNQRSWYGYCLSIASFCAKFPKGLIEALDQTLQRRLFEIQYKIKVPTILKKQWSTNSPKGFYLQFDGRIWITSQSWIKNSLDQKVFLMEHYYHQHPRVEKYKTLAYADLPTIAKHALRDLELKPLLNSFSKRSGPNCFATVAHAISTSSSSIADIWLHWEPLSRFLVEQGYKVTLDAPQAKDIAVFMQNGRAVHGSIYLGENIVFEKPGQDFYEPYIISKLEKSKSDWPKSKLHVWRKC